MPALMSSEVVVLTCSSLKKLQKKNDPDLSYHFLYGYNKDRSGEQAYLQVKKTKVARSDLKELKEKISASHRNSIIIGTVFYHEEKGTFEFRSKKAGKAKKSWPKAKKSKSLKTIRSKVGGFLISFLSSGPGAVIEEEEEVVEERESTIFDSFESLYRYLFCMSEPEVVEFNEVEEVGDQFNEEDWEDELADDPPQIPEGTPTTVENSLSAISNFILYQQEMLRGDSGRVDGVLTNQELQVSDSEGNEVEWSQETLEQTGLGSCFTLDSNGQLKLKESLLDNRSISKSERMEIAKAIQRLIQQGFSVRLAHGDSTLELEERDGVIYEEAHNPVLEGQLDFSRLDQTMPNSEPPMTFREAMTRMQNYPSDSEETKAINQQLASLFQNEKDSGEIPEDMSFLEYKLQFASLDVPEVLENGLRWHDGDGNLNLSEWSSLRMRVKDLPDEEQYYHWVTIKWEGSDGKEQDVTRRIALDQEYSSSEEAIPAIKKALEAEGWYTAKLDITMKRYDYSLPSKNELLPKLNDWSDSQISSLLMDENGDFGDIPPKEDFAKQVEDIAFMASMKQCQQNLGESISSLISGIPDTQKIFLRQSNGTDNSDELAGVDIGQTDIIRRGNDTGAFGKCAPTSYYCGAVCGLATGCRDGFTALKEDAATKTLATELETLFTKTPQEEEDLGRMDRIIQDLEAICMSDRSKRGLYTEVGKVAQMKECVIDRLQPKMDEEGPYFEMNFVLPRIRDNYGSNLRSGVYETKVRPQDIQEYLEQTNRADEYRGGRKHMMDHFKDPSSMSSLDFLKDLGPGLIAVGIDKTLKAAGKDSGLLYGPGASVVASMVTNERCKTSYMDFSDPIEAEPGTPEFKKEKKRRKKRMMSMLKTCKRKGRGVSVSMGYNSGNGHVNYLQDWGTPKIDGVEIDSLDLARCHMNQRENSASSSAWNNDRIQRFKMDTSKMAEGLTSIAEKFKEAGKLDRYNEIILMRDRALRTSQGSDLNALRDISSDVMEFMKDSLVLDSDNPNEDNISIMPSNTERDDSLSDNDGDRELVGGGSIGDQEEGSANVTDGSYFVPMDCLAAGWNGKEDKATGYAGYDTDDQFVMLSSLETMH